MAHPANIAAIDAGSNALRLLISHAESPVGIYPLYNMRLPVRLGHHAFTRRHFNARTISMAVGAFRKFRQAMDRFHVREYRAVATSASREARNRRELLLRIKRATGIELEVIDGVEEARLVRNAVQALLGSRIQPRLVVDLGG